MTTQQIESEIAAIFFKFSCSEKLQGSLPVVTPLTSGTVGSITKTSVGSVNTLVENSCKSQPGWFEMGIVARGRFLELLSELISEHIDDLAKLVHYDSGKSIRESKGEILSTVALIRSTIAAASYEPLANSAERSKEYTPLGLIAVISPFNFPLAIGMWTGIPALLAGNTVINKPSEHACLATLLYEAIFKLAIKQYNAANSTANVSAEIFQAAIGGPEIGQALVADRRVSKVIFTGSIAGCETVKAVDVETQGRVAALTEGGAANFAVYSNHHDGMTRTDFVKFIVDAIMKSYLPYAGQKCVNTRLVVVQEEIIDAVVTQFRHRLTQFLDDWRLEFAFREDNPFEFTPLINQQAVQRFKWACQQAIDQGGEVIGGKSLIPELDSTSQFVLPTIAVFAHRVALMDEEVFGPFLMIAPYSGGIAEALALAQRPNANLVNAYFGSDEREIAIFKQSNSAGFTLINPPLGTGLLPPYGLGFGGNGLSGQGESLPRDPLLPFVKLDGSIKRTVIFKLPVTDKAQT